MSRLQTDTDKQTDKQTELLYPDHKMVDNDLYTSEIRLHVLVMRQVRSIPIRFDNVDVTIVFSL